MKSFKFFTLFLLILGWLPIQAKYVDKQTAMAVGKRFIASAEGFDHLKSSLILSLSYEEKIGGASKVPPQKPEASYYIFNVNEDKGFIIVAADDHVIPILGYSSECGFDPNNIPPAVADWLQGYSNQIRFVSDFGNTSGYFTADLDMDRNVFVSDYNKWATNFGSTTGVGDGTFNDSCDSHVYKYLKIGTQTWMAENLAYLPSVNFSSDGSFTAPFFYINGYEGTSVAAAKASAVYGTYGVLYNWPAVMNGASSSTLAPSGVQGICSSGWHLPSNAEWSILTDYLINNGYGYGESGNDIGKSMAATSGWTSYSTAGTIGNDQTNNNRSGFNTLPGGYRWVDGGFYGLGGNAIFWSATEEPDSWAWDRYLSYDGDGVDRASTFRSNGCSIRCVKN